jgi:catechol 2,3-dioxygenase
VTTQERGTVQAPSAPVPPAAINHLVINVKDIERSHHFWSGLLGFIQCGQIGPRPDRPGFEMRFYQGSTGSHHDLALVQVPNPDAIPDPEGEWGMAPRGTGINHVAIKWPDRESWLRQIAWLQSQGVKFHRRVDHGMTHSVYISDPDGHGIEVLYELPREVWEGDINAALNWATSLPTEGAEVLEDNTDYFVFGRKDADKATASQVLGAVPSGRHRPSRHPAGDGGG